MLELSSFSDIIEIVNVKYLYANIRAYKLQEPSVERDNRKTTVMVVEDDRDILTVIGRGLEHAGFKVHAFADPLTALHHVQNGCRLPGLGV